MPRCDVRGGHDTTFNYEIYCGALLVALSLTPPEYLSRRAPTLEPPTGGDPTSRLQWGAMGPSRSRAPRHHPGGEAAHGHALRTVDDDLTALAPATATDERLAIRVFRAARRRRLAMPADQRPRLSPGLVAELEARGWDIPPELRPEPDAGHGPAEVQRRNGSRPRSRPAR